MNPVRREDGAEGRSLAGLALDAQYRLVTFKNVLDDGQAEARAPGLARTSAIDAIEALGEARQMLGGNPDAAVNDGKPRPAFALARPAQANLAAVR